jgi:hypothetical protein
MPGAKNAGHFFYPLRLRVLAVETAICGPSTVDRGLFRHNRLLCGMRSLTIISLIFLSFLASCGNEDSNRSAAPLTESENPEDAARNFINSLLKRDFNKARTFLVNDTLNNQYLDVTERHFGQMSQQEQLNYGSASINIAEVRKVSDTVSIIHYSNSYKKQPDSVRVVKQDGRWLIDLKYSLSGTPVQP